MTIAEKVELALIPVLGTGVWLLATNLPKMVSSGRLLLMASAIFLLQSLVRDLWLLVKAKQAIKSNVPKAAQCMCAESIVGVTGVVVGICLLGFEIDQSIAIENGMWGLLIIVVMTMGFAIKDYVIEWHPMRIRRDKDHMNIIFTWKR
jgi:hypothetical protein